MSESKIIKNSAYMAFGTIISRVTGVVRSAAIIAAIGFGPFADAYSIANSLPTIIYIVIIGGAINSIFVPQLVKHQKSDLDEGKSFSDKLLTFVIIILLSLSAIAVLLAPLIIKVYSPENWTQENFEVSVLFARFLLPQIFFYGLLFHPLIRVVYVFSNYLIRNETQVIILLYRKININNYYIRDIRYILYSYF